MDKYINDNAYEIKRKGKFLALILRHNPEKLNIELDKYGWANIKDLINSGQFTFEILEKIVEENDKGRFIFDEKKDKIRALQGHSINIDLGLKPIQPPEILFHGTAKAFKDSIFKNGINKGKRQYVHLSSDVETAINVGSRRDKFPMILSISAKKMYDDGYKFYLSENKVWLTDFVPSEYIIIKKENI